jgi:hypothetical protein
MANPKWVKGQSGNPGGRRKQDYRIRELAQQYTMEALATLRSIMKKSIDDRARVAAANAILDRGYGKPAQAIDLSAKDGSLADMFRNAVRSANGMTPEAPEEPGVDRSTH